MYVCMQVRISASLAAEKFHGFHSYSIFESLTIIGRCPVNINILAPKAGPLHWSPQTQKWDFLKKDINNFDELSVIYGDCLPQWNYKGGGNFSRITVRPLATQTRTGESMCKAFALILSLLSLF
jgi:hypothetical protein